MGKVHVCTSISVVTRNNYVNGFPIQHTIRSNRNKHVKETLNGAHNTNMV